MTEEDLVEAKYFQVRCLRSLGKTREALEVLNANKSLYNKNNYWKAVFQFYYGMTLFNVGEYEKVLEYLTNALKLSQNLQDQMKDTPFESKNR